ncbi:MAG: hypothetical protein COA79_15315 [Planctomycetota bacterium]|nr:MAG: hypothetical protein COA79_15315 [Planctomycetota bacterium]
MIINFIAFITRVLLRRRYKITIEGLDKIDPNKNYLILPNHPAFIDPLITYTTFMKLLKPRVLIDEKQSQRPGMNYLSKKINALAIPDVSKVGTSGKAKVRAVLDEIIKSLKNDDSVLLYPAGQVYRKKEEDLKGTSAVHQILEECPDVNILLVRTTGLWGSRFSFGFTGQEPEMGSMALKAMKHLILNLLFFMPKRPVNLELMVADDIPRNGTRPELNKYLEAYYNKDVRPNMTYPNHFILGNKPKEVDEPENKKIEGDVSDVSQSVKDQVFEYLEKETGVKEINANHQLAQDLNMDSLTKTDLVVWLEGEFGCHLGNAESIHSVKDVLLAASGVVLSGVTAELKKVPTKWFTTGKKKIAVKLDDGANVAEVFLKRAKKNINQVVVADEMRGAMTYRNLITAILVLKPEIEKLEGEKVGILLPASVGSVIIYFATVFAGKVPVMINWTVGNRNMRNSLDGINVEAILTSRLLISKLKSQGTNFRGLEGKLVFLEDVGKSISKFTKIKALVKSYINWSDLYKAKIQETSVILFTSGSESLPKAVPLKHKNQLENIKGVLELVEMYECDRFIAFLPPFHSFGITVTTLFTVLLGLQTVYHPNPTDAGHIGKLIDAYKATLLPGTPTFLSGIVRATEKEMLKTLRIAVAGAEKCTDATYDLLLSKCPDMKVLEGYGITECSPVVSINPASNPKKGSIGKLLPSLDWMLVHPETMEELDKKSTGMLLVSGPTIFSGYINYEGKSPFHKVGDKLWYKTGDLVSFDEDGYLIFKGRQKRFIKLGGEMVSLPAIETVLIESFHSADDDGPTIAIEATPHEEKPEIVLFTTKDISREEVNQSIKDHGLSGLHNVRQIIQIDEIPVLGTGKTDYKSLKAKLDS